MSVDLTPVKGFQATQTTVTAVPLSIVVYFKPDDVAGTPGSAQRILCTLNNSGDVNHSFRIYQDATTVRASTHSGSGSIAATPAGTLGASVWRAAIAVFDITTATDRLIDVNNLATPVTQGTNRTPSGINQIRIGALSTAAQGFNGEIARIAIYNIILSQADRDILGCADSSFFGYDPRLFKPANLVWYWELYDASGPIQLGGFGPALTWSEIGAGAAINGVGQTNGVFYPKRDVTFVPAVVLAPSGALLKVVESEGLYVGSAA